MKINIIGNGSFGTFLRELLAAHFRVTEDAETIILAVPISAYGDVAAANKGKHLINVCSVQQPSMEMILSHSEMVTGVHPLFGRKTPTEHRNSIITRRRNSQNDASPHFAHKEADFFDRFSKVSKLIYTDAAGIPFTPETHDRLMAKTHVAAVLAARQIKVFIDGARDIPDDLVPNSFRLMREFVKTLDDMPRGTIESILANPYY